MPFLQPPRLPTAANEKVLTFLSTNESLWVVA